MLLLYEARRRRRTRPQHTSAAGKMSACTDVLASDLADAFGEEEAMEALRAARTRADALFAAELLAFVACEPVPAADWTSLDATGDDVALFF